MTTEFSLCCCKPGAGEFIVRQAIALFPLIGYTAFVVPTLDHRTWFVNRSKQWALDGDGGSTIDYRETVSDARSGGVTLISHLTSGPFPPIPAQEDDSATRQDSRNPPTGSLDFVHIDQREEEFTPEQLRTKLDSLLDLITFEETFWPETPAPNPDGQYGTTWSVVIWPNLRALDQTDSPFISNSLYFFSASHTPTRVREWDGEEWVASTDALLAPWSGGDFPLLGSPDGPVRPRPTDSRDIPHALYTTSWQREGFPKPGLWWTGGDRVSQPWPFRVGWLVKSWLPEGGIVCERLGQIPHPLAFDNTAGGTLFFIPHSLTPKTIGSPHILPPPPSYALRHLTRGPCE